MPGRREYFYSLCTILLLALNSVCHALTLVEDATILTMAQAEKEAFIGYVLIDDDGRIRQVAEGSYKGAAVESTIDASGKIIIPGFVSGHNHLWQSAFRGISANTETWPWLHAMPWKYGDHFGQGDFYNFTLHGALDQLAHGITTTYNHSQRLEATEEHYLESLTASVDSGQRFVFAYKSDLNLSNSSIRKNIVGLVERFRADTSPGNMLALSLNVSVYRPTPAQLRLQLELAREYGLTVQTHYLEEFSRRAKEHLLWPELLAAGAVADNISYAHFVHPTDAILKDTAERGAAMIWNPLSNGRLASGMPDIPRYLTLGIEVGMGLDGGGSADIADPFENMRMGLYGLRASHKSAAVMSPLDVLRLHTLATAKVMKVDLHIGSLEAGKWADFLIIDPDAPVTGALFDAAATLVFSCSADNIQQVYVAGKLLVEDGKVLGHDLAGIQEEIKQRVSRIRSVERNSP